MGCVGRVLKLSAPQFGAERRRGGADPDGAERAQPGLVPADAADGVDRAWSHCRFRNRGSESLRKYDMKWMQSSRQTDNATEPQASTAVGATMPAVGALLGFAIGPASHGPQSYSCTLLYISVVMLYRKYTGVRNNDFTVHDYM